MGSSFSRCHRFLVCSQASAAPSFKSPASKSLDIDEFARFVFSNQRCSELEKLVLKIRRGSDQRGTCGIARSHLRADQLGANFRQREKTHPFGEVSGIPSQQLLPPGQSIVVLVTLHVVFFNFHVRLLVVQVE